MAAYFPRSLIPSVWCCATQQTPALQLTRRPNSPRLYNHHNESTIQMERSCCNGSSHPRSPLLLTFMDATNLCFRRIFLLGTIAFSSNTYASAATADRMVELDLPRFRKTQSGVKIQDVVEGLGPEAKEGDEVEFNYVCRRTNGYFVYSTINQFSGESRPISLTLGSGKIIRGLEEVLQGMKLGGKRRALIPPELGYVELDLEPQPQEFGPQRSLISHVKEPLVFEVQLLRVS